MATFSVQSSSSRAYFNFSFIKISRDIGRRSGTRDFSSWRLITTKKSKLLKMRRTQRVMYVAASYSALISDQSLFTFIKDAEFMSFLLVPVCNNTFNVVMLVLMTE